MFRRSGVKHLVWLSSFYLIETILYIYIWVGFDIWWTKKPLLLKILILSQQFVPCTSYLSPLFLFIVRNVNLISIHTLIFISWKILTTSKPSRWPQTRTSIPTLLSWVFHFFVCSLHTNSFVRTPLSVHMSVYRKWHNSFYYVVIFPTI